MKIDEGTLDRIAELARLDITDPQLRRDRMADMQRIIDFVEVLAQVDTRGVEPLIFMTEEQDVLRPDEPRLEISKEQVLANAPVKDSDYFEVPRVVG
ncbi:MAG: Asp-tRNA(Asn)/Glu-tRNA(Gln) amidotransferase subunit GatC [Flavobacteriales bacterium]|nr:Asp-tRNA(Asn)/Glu-tRNA(Gln) amidotransferase subunit GatC [Flavobacteriales bacterium]MEB2342014.1 Asp-tRNA(Asn)/Glu-tRNA(Gln) amidotransferase subunit GatC [Flavobacteriia bacterium]